MSNQRNAAEILRSLANIRAAIPHLGATAPTNDESSIAGQAFMASGTNDDALADFETQAVVDGLESLASELSSTLDAMEAKLMDDALDVYYAAEELARDPAHAEVIPHVEAMRQAYERDFGHPIPPRSVTAAERKRRTGPPPRRRRNRAHP